MEPLPSIKGEAPKPADHPGFHTMQPLATDSNIPTLRGEETDSDHHIDDTDNTTSGSTTPRDEEPPYHIYSRRQKWVLVCLVSFAGLLSPLSSNIYFPAIDTISQDLGVNTSLVALTISIYMVVQGIAPSIFGALSDSCGRRMVFIMTFTVYLAANLGLAFTTNYPMLLVLRGLQAAGSSANISISAGVISDIADRSERGGFIGTGSGIR